MSTGWQMGGGGAALINLVNQVRSANPYVVGGGRYSDSGSTNVQSSFGGEGGSSFSSGAVIKAKEKTLVQKIKITPEINTDKAVQDAIAQLRLTKNKEIGKLNAANKLLDKKLRDEIKEKTTIIAKGAAITAKTKAETDKKIIDFSKIKGKIAVQLNTIDNQGFIIDQLRREVWGYITANKKLLAKNSDLADKRDQTETAINSAKVANDINKANEAKREAAKILEEQAKVIKENNTLIKKAEAADRLKKQKEKELIDKQNRIKLLIDAKNLLAKQLADKEKQRKEENEIFRILVNETENKLDTQKTIISTQKTTIGDLQIGLENLFDAGVGNIIGAGDISSDVRVDPIVPVPPNPLVINRIPWKNVIPWAVIIATVAASSL